MIRIYITQMNHSVNGDTQGSRQHVYIDKIEICSAYTYQQYQLLKTLSKNYNRKK